MTVENSVKKVKEWIDAIETPAQKALLETPAIVSKQISYTKRRRLLVAYKEIEPTNDKVDRTIEKIKEILCCMQVVVIMWILLRV